ncbi:ATP-binding cassette domain-containing protein [Moritella sp. Urea-trap-13]|uniref:ATP-binding cassette domain-containing protein n=1 Tax=Moritella sp. Urea-trap-13 TaxID=2058327 RepID=UPI000C31DD20|nr:ATP-binding cassette domain-containing protein [Moritella sp. Urea-trap-13]PKH08131.1 ABC transporter ATP-binding protein [Moritella sp. Urea-trap-13]
MPLSVNNLSILDRSERPLFAPISFTVSPGEILTLMGPSGCGKSSLLSAIAGHKSADFSYQGECYYQQRLLNELPPEKRNIGILFQDDLLFPHLNIWENLAIALPNHIKKTQRKAQALKTLAELNLVELADKSPMQISGGQRARISMMRLLLAEPAVVLLDEPFSKLDKSLRSEFRNWVFTQTLSRQLPVLMVTHDADDVPNGSRCLHWPWNKETQDA